MGMNLEHTINPDPRCPVILLLDTSSSMQGEAIAQLNQGIISFQQEIYEDRKASRRVEVAIVSFGSSVTLQQPFIQAREFQPPTLTANGSTPMGAGMTIALEELKRRRIDLQNSGIGCYRPWIVLITDGEPNDEGWQTAAARIRQEVDNDQVFLFIVAVDDANMDILRQIAHPEFSPAKLNGYDFRGLFGFLSGALIQVSTGEVGDQITVKANDSFTFSTGIGN